MNEAGPIRGRCDAHGLLIEADEPLARLQRDCGGELPGTIAVPQLHALIEHCRAAQAGGSRRLWARSGASDVHFWAEATPDAGGYAIALAGWEEQPSPMSHRLFDNRQSAALARAGASAVLRLDRDQRIVSITGEGPALAEFAARARSSAGQPWRDLIVATQGEAQRLSGAHGWWRASLHPLTGRMGALLGHELFLAPITVRDALAAAESAQQAAELALTLEQDLAPALAGPVASVVANAERIAARLLGPLDDGYAQYGHDIRAAATHLGRLVEDLGRDGAIGNPSARMGQIDLTQLSAAAAAILQPLAVEKGIRLATTGSGAVAAWGDATAVVQILLNLIGNALRYAPRGSEVAVSAVRVDSRALIHVDDRGPGIPADQREQVFARYERLGRREDGGSGLGLAISRRLARDMGGEITVEGREQGGSRFTLALNAEARAP